MTSHNWMHSTVLISCVWQCVNLQCFISCHLRSSKTDIVQDHTTVENDNATKVGHYESFLLVTQFVSRLKLYNQPKCGLSWCPPCMVHTTGEFALLCSVYPFRFCSAKPRFVDGSKMVNGPHLYSAFLQSALQCWLTFTHSCTHSCAHSHTDGGGNHAGATAGSSGANRVRRLAL